MCVGGWKSSHFLFSFRTLKRFPFRIEFNHFDVIKMEMAHKQQQKNQLDNEVEEEKRERNEPKNCYLFNEFELKLRKWCARVQCVQKKWAWRYSMWFGHFDRLRPWQIELLHMRTRRACTFFKWRLCLNGKCWLQKIDEKRMSWGDKCGLFELC